MDTRTQGHRVLLHFGGSGSPDSLGFHPNPTRFPPGRLLPLLSRPGAAPAGRERLPGPGSAPGRELLAASASSSRQGEFGVDSLQVCVGCAGTWSPLLLLSPGASGMRWSIPIPAFPRNPIPGLPERPRVRSDASASQFLQWGRGPIPAAGISRLQRPRCPKPGREFHLPPLIPEVPSPGKPLRWAL